ncbi:hypothetical protein ONS96_004997 [Cadophora gregata f. sp. sojae]|nr:hypothetical protein ONS96_004997 [Cadophora gregata f. sp. sojae]
MASQSQSLSNLTPGNTLVLDVPKKESPADQTPTLNSPLLRSEDSDVNVLTQDRIMPFIEPGAPSARESNRHSTAVQDNALRPVSSFRGESIVGSEPLGSFGRSLPSLRGLGLLARGDGDRPSAVGLHAARNTRGIESGNARLNENMGEDVKEEVRKNTLTKQKRTARFRERREMSGSGANTMFPVSGGDDGNTSINASRSRGPFNGSNSMLGRTVISRSLEETQRQRLSARRDSRRSSRRDRIRPSGTASTPITINEAEKSRPILVGSSESPVVLSSDDNEDAVLPPSQSTPMTSRTGTKGPEPSRRTFSRQKRLKILENREEAERSSRQANSSRPHITRETAQSLGFSQPLSRSYFHRSGQNALHECSACLSSIPREPLLPTIRSLQARVNRRIIRMQQSATGYCETRNPNQRPPPTGEITGDIPHRFDYRNTASTYASRAFPYFEEGETTNDDSPSPICQPESQRAQCENPRYERPKLSSVSESDTDGEVYNDRKPGGDAPPRKRRRLNLDREAKSILQSQLDRSIPPVGSMGQPGELITLREMYEEFLRNQAGETFDDQQTVEKDPSDVNTEGNSWLKTDSTNIDRAHALEGTDPVYEQHNGAFSDHGNDGSSRYFTPDTQRRLDAEGSSDS